MSRKRSHDSTYNQSKKSKYVPIEIIKNRHPKIVLIGDGCTGKSTFFDFIKQKTVSKTYRHNRSYNATHNFDIEHINIKTKSNQEFDITLWDTAGQENYGGKLRNDYLLGADAVIVMYDVTSKTTATNINKWLTDIKDISPNIPVAVIGNKSDELEKLDLCSSVKLRDSKLIKDYGSNNIKNFLISIKENTNISEDSGFFTTSYNENKGCLIGLEYVLSKIAGFGIEILY
tara:strand:+ start:3381 stop:4070 length:690 start_codon:yes stop_codon:yes gene_type:complete